VKGGELMTRQEGTEENGEAKLRPDIKKNTK